MEVLRYAAFTDDPAGGNPAGVVLDAGDLGDDRMLAVAADLGYSETAFLAPRGDGRFGVRYFSPLAEVPFCGHATIATGVAWAERHGGGMMLLDTASGEVRVRTSPGEGGTSATLTNVPPRVVGLDDGDLERLLDVLRWSPGDLDTALPPRVAYAGAWHPVVGAATRQRLTDLEYDFNALKELMAERGWTTVQLVHRTGEVTFDVRNPFPPGGIVEDPATGAAAAALGGYLRELGLVPLPATLHLRQGDDLGRPSRLTVDVPVEPGTGISVTGTAVPISAAAGRGRPAPSRRAPRPPRRW
jgi:PhzF family phenazine biosynthesis protein